MRYNAFIDKLHGGKIVASDLYAVEPSGSKGEAFIKAITSPSVWLFYLVLLVLIVIAMVFVISSPASATQK